MYVLVRPVGQRQRTFIDQVGDARPDANLLVLSSPLLRLSPTDREEASPFSKEG